MLPIRAGTRDSQGFAARRSPSAMLNRPIGIAVFHQGIHKTAFSRETPLPMRMRNPEARKSPKGKGEVWRIVVSAPASRTSLDRPSMRLSWRSAVLGQALQRGNLVISIGADWSDGEAGFSTSFRLSQTFRVSSRLDIALALKSPEGGYALDAVPCEFPCIAVEFSFWTG